MKNLTTAICLAITSFAILVGSSLAGERKESSFVVPDAISDEDVLLLLEGKLDIKTWKSTAEDDDDDGNGGDEGGEGEEGDEEADGEIIYMSSGENGEIPVVLAIHGPGGGGGGAMAPVTNYVEPAAIAIQFVKPGAASSDPFEDDCQTILRMRRTAKNANDRAVAKLKRAVVALGGELYSGFDGYYEFSAPKGSIGTSQAASAKKAQKEQWDANGRYQDTIDLLNSFNQQNPGCSCGG